MSTTTCAVPTYETNAEPQTTTGRTIGKKVLITGGSRGSGKATAEQIAGGSEYVIDGGMTDV